MKDAGYTMVTDYQEGSRVFNAKRSTPWVQDDVISVPAEIDEWTEMAKGWYDNGYMKGVAVAKVKRTSKLRFYIGVVFIIKR